MASSRSTTTRPDVASRRSASSTKTASWRCMRWAFESATARPVRSGWCGTSYDTVGFAALVEAPSSSPRYGSAPSISSTASAQSPSTAPDPVRSAPGASPGEELGTNFLIFIDDALSIARDRNRVLSKIAEQILGRGLRDRVAMLAYDGSTLDTLTQWTSDPSTLERAIAAATARPAYGAQRMGELRMMDGWADDKRFQEQEQARLMAKAAASGGAPDIGGAGGGDNGGNQGGGGLDDRELAPNVLTGFLSGPDLATAQRLSNTVERGVAASVRALRSSAAPPGRKVMIMLLGGWPLSPASYVANRFGDSLRDLAAGDLDQGYAKSSELFGPLTDTANLLGYTLYPVDVAGQMRRIGWDATDSPDQFELNNPTSGIGGGTTDRELNVHAAIGHLAKETGGLPMINSLRDQAFAKAFEDTRSFYWLGFTPQRSGDDSNHRVSVSVRGREGLSVRTRGGFVDMSRVTEQQMAIESALLFDSPPLGNNASPAPSALAVSYGQPQKAKSRKMMIAVEVGIPLDTVTLLQQGGRFLNQLEIRFLVMDNDGNRSEVSVDRIQINGSAAPSPGQRYWYETTLYMRRRDHRVVVTVYDPLSGATLTSSADIEA